jgi:hypothetical protein
MTVRGTPTGIVAVTQSTLSQRASWQWHFASLLAPPSVRVHHIAARPYAAVVTTAQERLAAEFEQASRDAVEECRRFHYNPTVWIAMMNDVGAVEAARRLLLSPDIQSGFERLAREGRVDLTVEFAVLHPRWDRLFGPAEREAAWWRLQQATRTP